MIYYGQYEIEQVFLGDIEIDTAYLGADSSRNYLAPDGGGEGGGTNIGSVDISLNTEELTEDYINLEVGMNIKDVNGNKVAESYDQYKLESATDTEAGLMSARDKKKLDEMYSTYDTKEETLTDDSKIPVSNANGDLLYITLGDIKKYLGLIKQYFTLGVSRLNGQDVLK